MYDIGRLASGQPHQRRTHPLGGLSERFVEQVAITCRRVRLGMPKERADDGQR